MSDVNKFYPVEDFSEVLCVLATDFDDEHILRIETELRVDIAQRQRDVANKRADAAERQVGELRRLIAERSALHQLCIRLLGQSKANLNASGNLAKEIRKVLNTDHKLNRILNTTCTEGKDQ